MTERSEVEPQGVAPQPTAVVQPTPPKRRRILRRVAGAMFLFCLVAILAGRLAMPTCLRWYVNSLLSKSQVYSGKIGDIEVHLYRGAYTIRDIRLVKTTGNVPVPLFSASRVDLAIEWPAILRRRIVGQIMIDRPELNFVDDPGSGEGQTGAGGPWLQIIRGLFPFQINSVRINDGSVHFRTYAAQRPVDVFLSQMQATVDDLSNVENSTKPLLTTIHATALAMDEAKFELRIKLDPFSYEPTFHLAMRLLGLDVTKTNDLIRAYGGFDVKRGWFDLVTEIDAKEGVLDGYVKPLFRDLKVFDLVQDVKQDDPPQVFWQLLVGTVAEVLKNHPRDQVATVIPLSGNLGGPQPDILAAIGNTLLNAFVRAYLPRLERERHITPQDMQFGPPSLTDTISPTETD